MALEADYLELMPDTVTFYAKSSLDQYGKRTFSGTGTSYRCRIQAVNQLTRDPDGREVTVTGIAYLYGSPDLTTDHKIVLPDGTTPVIYQVNSNRDEAGAHHTVVLFGRG